MDVNEKHWIYFGVSLMFLGILFLFIAAIYPELPSWVFIVYSFTGVLYALITLIVSIGEIYND